MHAWVEWDGEGDAGRWQPCESFVSRLPAHADRIQDSVADLREPIEATRKREMEKPNLGIGQPSQRT